MERGQIRLGAVGPRSWAKAEAEANGPQATHGGYADQRESFHMPGFLPGHVIIAGQYWTENVRHPPLSRWPLAPSPFREGTSAPIEEDTSSSAPSREIWRLHRRSTHNLLESQQPSSFSSPIRHSTTPSLHPLPPMPPDLPSPSAYDLTQTPSTPPRASTALTTPDSASSHRSKWQAQADDFEADLIDLSARMMKGFVNRVSRFPLLISFKLWAAEARGSRPLRLRAESLRSNNLLCSSLSSLQMNAEMKGRSRRLKEESYRFLAASKNLCCLIFQAWHCIALNSSERVKRHQRTREMHRMRKIVGHWALWAEDKAYWRIISEELNGEYALKLLVSVLHQWDHLTQSSLERRRSALNSHFKASELSLQKKAFDCLKAGSEESTLSADAALISMARFRSLQILRSWHILAETRLSLQKAERLILSRAAELRSEQYFFDWRTVLIEKQRVVLLRGLKIRRCLQRWMALSRQRSARLSALSVEIKGRFKTLLCLLVLRCWRSHVSESTKRVMRRGQWPLMCRCFHTWRSLAIARTSHTSLSSSPLLVPSTGGRIKCLFDRLVSKNKQDDPNDDPFAQLSHTLSKTRRWYRP